jgi:hypothetical protein
LPESEFVVCALADKTCEFGMIKKKILVMTQHILKQHFDTTIHGVK